MSIDLSQFEAGKIYDGTYDKDLKSLQDRLSELQALHILHEARTLSSKAGMPQARAEQLSA
jgi:hypothetical protein